MVEILKSISFIVSTIWFFFAIRKIIKGNNNPILYVICVFYIFFSTPLILDLTIGLPNYRNRLGFYLASRDALVSNIYSIFVAIVPFFWWKTCKNIKAPSFKSLETNKVINKYKKIIILFAFILLISPLIVWIFSPNPNLYLTYGESTNRGFNNFDIEYHFYINMATYASILGSCILFVIRKKELSLFFTTILAPFLFLSIWLSGKRFTVILIILLFSFLFLNKGLLKGPKLYFYIIIIGTVFIGYSNFYQSTYRFESYSEPDLKYENIRIDFGRDDVTKTAMYAELDPNYDILDFRGQSLLVNSLFFIPRDLWGNKPWPYAKYATSAMFYEEFQFRSWGVTTSIIDSAIADFSWLGLLIGPSFICIICHIGSRKQDYFNNILTILVACLFLVLHLPAFAPIWVIWLMMIFIVKRNNKEIVSSGSIK